MFVLHSSNSGNQFVPLMGLLPEVSWERTALGVKSHQDRKLPDGKVFHRVTEVMMPNLRIVANPFVKRYGRTDSVARTLPVDNTTTKIFTLYRTPKGERVSRVRFNGKRWAELTEEEHQRMPNDYEAQVGQGAITLHSEEHLAASDRADGGPVGDALKTRKIKAGDIAVLLVEVTGTFAAGMPGGPAGPERPNYMLLGAIAQGPDANWFFRATGPRATLEAQRAAFDGLIRSLRRGQGV